LEDINESKYLDNLYQNMSLISPQEERRGPGILKNSIALPDPMEFSQLLSPRRN